MSEENPSTVTNSVKTHVKDPKKVEAGRKLAKISQEANARTRAQLEAIKEEQNVLDVENKCEGSAITLERVGMVVGITVGLGNLYVMWCNRREKSEKIEKVNPQRNHNPHQNRTVVLTCLTEDDKI
ncbi:Hypothetical predicted protein [Paramuricea clavata]|uniref:Uncharacterized protein n=1 Tax=Paramuricea clavata TaxID=317549 RepID=A0A6S7GFH8_PARCT|nr:Hypothetical predicted protein [Paramuricea clavata]